MNSAPNTFICKVKSMDNYLGVHIDWCSTIMSSCFVFWLFLYRDLKSENSLARFLFPDLEFKNLLKKSVLHTTLGPLIFAGILLFYPIGNLLGIYENYSNLHLYDLSYVKHMEIDRGLLGIRIAAFFTGYRLLRLLKINLTLDFETEFGTFYKKWYSFVYIQYYFYSASIFLFFALNAVTADENIILWRANELDISVSFLLSLISSLLSFSVLYIIDDWRVMTDYMLNSGGLMFKEHFMSVRRFNYAIFLGCCLLFGLRASTMNGLFSSDFGSAVMILTALALIALAFFAIELGPYKKTKTVEFEASINAYGGKGGLRTQEVIQFDETS